MFALVLPVLLSLLDLMCLRVAAVSSPPRNGPSPLLASQPGQDTFSFIGHGVPLWGHPGGRAVGCRSALGALPYSFGRRKSASDASDGERQQQPRQQQHAVIDLYRLMGVAPNASTSAVSARTNELQRQLQQLSGVRSAPADPLLYSLLQEVSAALQDTQQRAAFDNEGLIPASLSALLDQLPVAASPPHSLVEEEEETATEEAHPGKEGLGAEGPHDLFSALLGGGLLGTSPFASASEARRGGLQPQRGPNVEAAVSLGFVAAALQGARSLPVTVQRLKECDACGGTGGAGGSKANSCKACSGRGLKTEVRLGAPAWEERAKERARARDGARERVTEIDIALWL